MQSVAAQNARVHDAVYHVVVSWQEGEFPTDEQAFICGAHVRASVGMTNHQYVMAIHRDTGHVHLHITINRVNPESYRAVYPDRDFYKLDRAMRELELRFGWRHDRGPYAVFERNGTMVIDWTSEVPQTKERMPTAARDMERHSDQESFFSYVRSKLRSELVAALRDPDLDWQGLHRILARHGVSIRPKGQGLAVFDAMPGPLAQAACIQLKASDVHEALSKGRLEQRLGAFETAQFVGAPDDVYDRLRSPMRIAEEREDRRRARAEARRVLRERYQEYVAALPSNLPDSEVVKSRLELLRTKVRENRASARLEPDLARRKALLSVIAFVAARDRQRLLQEMRQERATLRVKNARSRQSYREWVEQRAAEGDLAAIAQLRGWAYAATRRRTAPPADIDHGDRGFGLAGGADLDNPWFLPGLSWSILRSGAIRYRAGEDGYVTDHGERIDIEAHRSLVDAIRLGLAIAHHNFPDSVSVEGGQGFRELVRLIRLDTPDNDARLLSLASELLEKPQADRRMRLSGFKPDRN